MAYRQFVDLKFKPTERHVIAEYAVEPAHGTSLQEAAGGVAAESSVGTWTHLTTISDKRQREKMARVFEIKNNGRVKVAYPPELFEQGNMPQIMSSIAGNVFGVDIIKNLRFEDVHFPKQLAQSFKGPKYGIKGIRKLMRVPKRPFVGTIVKPKLGLSAKEHAAVAYEAWVGGCDFVKDDENLSSMSFNRFNERIKLTLKARDKAERETGERKMYFPNVTAESLEAIERAKFVKSQGGEYAMVDFITIGFSGMQTIRDADLGLVLHGHRAMHAALDRNRKHGVSMLVLAKAARLLGVDQLHVGTAGAGKMDETAAEDIAYKKALEEPLYGIKPVLSVCSGGLHPGHLPYLVKTLGYDIVCQFGGGIHGHPQGTRVGATAARQALEATMQRTTLKEYTRTHEPLAIALKHWSK